MFGKNKETEKVIDFDLKKEDEEMKMKWYEKIIAKVSQNPIATGIGVGVAIIGATVTAIMLSGGSEDDSIVIEPTDDDDSVRDEEA